MSPRRIRWFTSRESRPYLFERALVRYVPPYHGSLLMSFGMYMCYLVRETAIRTLHVHRGAVQPPSPRPFAWLTSGRSSGGLTRRYAFSRCLYNSIMRRAKMGSGYLAEFFPRRCAAGTIKNYVGDIAATDLARPRKTHVASARSGRSAAVK